MQILALVAKATSVHRCASQEQSPHDMNIVWPSQAIPRITLVLISFSKVQKLELEMKIGKWSFTLLFKVSYVEVRWNILFSFVISLWPWQISHSAVLLLESAFKDFLFIAFKYGHLSLNTLLLCIFVLLERYWSVETQKALNKNIFNMPRAYIIVELSVFELVK